MNTKMKGVFFGIAIIIGLVFVVYVFYYYPLKQENTLFKTILYTDSQVLEVSVDSQKANDYYNEASLSYEKEDYDSVESNCRLARGYFATTSQSYKDIESELEISNIQDPLIDKYIESLKVLSEIRWNLYEACEHFESASRYYDIYFNTNVPASDSSYEMAGNEMDSMNEKITLHDENIREYNNLLSEFKIELKKRLD